MNQKAFIFIGRSGCGKGTQAKLLKDYLKKNDPARDVLYIQSGSEYREFIKGNSITQQLSKKIYDAGGLQPEFLSIYMWTNVLVREYKNGEHLIIDGSPRKYHEAGALDSIFDYYKINEKYLIHIDIDKETSIDRLMARGRIDDNREDIEERLSWYETEVVPAIGYYENNKNYKYIKIKGNRTVDEVFNEMIERVKLA